MLVGYDRQDATSYAVFAYVTVYNGKASTVTLAKETYRASAPTTFTVYDNKSIEAGLNLKFPFSLFSTRPGEEQEQLKALVKLYFLWAGETTWLALKVRAMQNFLRNIENALKKVEEHKSNASDEDEGAAGTTTVVDTPMVSTIPNTVPQSWSHLQHPTAQPGYAPLVPDARSTQDEQGGTIAMMEQNLANVLPAISISAEAPAALDSGERKRKAHIDEFCMSKLVAYKKSRMDIENAKLLLVDYQESMDRKMKRAEEEFNMVLAERGVTSTQLLEMYELAHTLE